MIASVSKTSKIVVEKSTVPVKTAEAIEKVCVVFERQRDLPLQPLSACRTVDRWMSASSGACRATQVLRRNCADANVHFDILSK